MDPNALNTARQGSLDASNNLANLSESSPSLLQSLQKNLVGIFTKDNPLINERENALTTYLSTPSATRASLLSSNLPVVAGSNLNLSPTQQNAIVQGREAAALAPLAGLNQAVTGMYGNIPQMVSNAGDIYKSLIGAATTRAQSARQNYEDLFNMLKTNEQFDIEKEKNAILRARYANASSKQSAAQQAKLTSNVNDIDNAIIKIRNAKQAASAGGSGLEAFNPFGIRSSLPQNFLGLGPKTVNLNSKLGEANTEWFNIAGKALTKNERELIQVPQSTDRADIINQRLSDMEATLLRKRDQLLSGGAELYAPGDTGVGTGMDTTGGDWEVQ